MRRREFIAALGGAAAWPLLARAQQPGKVRTIGFLGLASASAWSRWTAPFVQRLRELDWVQGRNLAIEYRWLEEHPEVRSSEDIVPAFDQLGGAVQALYIVTDPLLFLNRVRLAELAGGARLPTMCGILDYVEAGGLVSYGPEISDMFRRAGDYVDKILRGAKPADLPVEQPAKFTLVINLKTARAIGHTVPPSLLARADKVIE